MIRKTHLLYNQILINMKKYLFVAMAAFLMVFAACKGKAKEEKIENVKIPETFVTYENDNFSVQYPGDMKVTWSTGFLNARTDDTEGQFDASFSDMAPAVSELKKYSENLAYMYKNMGETCEDPKVKDKVMTMRTTNGEYTRDAFIVLDGNGNAVSGSLQYTQNKAEEYKNYIAPIVASVKFK